MLEYDCMILKRVAHDKIPQWCSNTKGHLKMVDRVTQVGLKLVKSNSKGNSNNKINLKATMMVRALV